MLRYYWTIVVLVALFLIIGAPVVFVGHIMLAVFGVKEFIFPYAKFGCRIWLWSAGARVHVKGRENLDPNQSYLFIANHQSNLDPPLLFIHLGHNTGGIAKKELAKYPILKQAFPLAHIVPIDRRNRASAIESTKLGAAELQKGHNLMAFPEGTRTTDGKVLEFKKGVFFMALEAGAPVVPVAINFTGRVMPKGRKVVTPGDVFVEILTPVSTAGYTEETIADLVEIVRNQIVGRVRAD
ncbi:MAG: lysophospholipid acyltransferase family protein [Blastocatellia bacterium]